MNIQQYMTPDIIGPLTFVSILFVAFLSSIQITKLTQALELLNEEEDDEDHQEVKPFVRRPQAGELWYPRMSAGCPWPVDTEPVKIMEVRNGWLKFSDGENTSTVKTEDFSTVYMRDDYGDFIVKAPIDKPIELEESEDIPPIPEIPEESGFNVIKIHGEDFVLTPLEKKENE